MPFDLPNDLRRVLSDKLTESLSGPIPEGTAREFHGRVEFPGKATAVIGMRRAGKTTFLHQLRRERIAEGAARESVPYINFEDERLGGLEGHHLGFLVEEYSRQVREHAESDVVNWYLDEIQLVPGWERFVRRLLDEGEARIVLTGSSAALLSREVATSMRGRAWEVPIFPFSFREALRHRGARVHEPNRSMTAKARRELERHFLEWLRTGGFPEAQAIDDASRLQLLRDYVDVAILRDVVERHGVTQVAGLRWIVRHLLGNAAGTFSVEKFYSALKSQGVAIAKDTVHQLLAHLEEAFLIRTVWIEAHSERGRMVNPRKAYPIDPGLIPIFDRSGRSNVGHTLEIAVLIELQRRRCDVTYVRTRSGYEVDFLARSPEGVEELIQVCANASTSETSERECRALAEAMKSHPKARGRLLTATRDGNPAEGGEGAVVQTAYEWMLGGV